jgi:tripartite ATP-independent transporter DctP family solute receptor
VIKLAHGVNEQDCFHIAAVKFKGLVEQRTHGQVKIEIYPNGSLGDERTVIEGMQYGTVGMGVCTTGPVANFLPEISVFEMPFLFSSPRQAYKVLDGPVGKKVLAKLDGLNLKGLAFAERGFRDLTNSKRPVLKPEDIKGLKIRVMENPLYIDTFKTLGANATPMAWPETLTALQQGVVDGQENPINAIYAFKLYETQKYLSMTNHTYAPAIFIMNKKIFASLDKKAQGIVVKAAQEAAVYERKWNAGQMGKQMQVLKEKGMQIAKPDLKPFQAAMKPVYDKYGPKFGSLLKEIQAAKK